MYQTHTLSNGLRIICEQRKSPVVYCGYVIMAGTRDEAEADAGMAHFIEHMTFKGTQRRRACHINNGLERVGGDLNAFTNKQETVYYATLLREHLPRAIDLLTDIVFHSTYPQHEIEREVEVICDEIDSYLDTPSELIFDDFESLIFKGSALGRDILGKAERLREYTTADALRFTRRHYRPDHAVLFVLGDVDIAKMARCVEQQFARYPLEIPDEIAVFRHPQPHDYSRDLTAIPRESRHVFRQKDTHQAHVMIGNVAFGGTDERKPALSLLNNMLGGPGMNSRLNMAVRERAGLVYSIDSYVSTFPDTGYWNIYFGCDPKDVRRCCNLIEREIRRFIQVQLTPTQLAAAKRQLRGQLGISTDAHENYALAMAKTFAWYNHHRDIAKIFDEIEEITAEELSNLAAHIYNPDTAYRLIYAPSPIHL